MDTSIKLFRLDKLAPDTSVFRPLWRIQNEPMLLRIGIMKLPRMCFEFGATIKYAIQEKGLFTKPLSNALLF
jgi:hypothetical protein